MTIHFDRFAVGDVAVFEHCFPAADYAQFAAMSGDYSPSHDPGQSGELATVPLHLLVAPLSRVAGMIFPGEPALCLGTDARPLLPVFYGEALHYSARIASLSQAGRVLGLRVLVLRGSDVVLEASMRVQAKCEQWEKPSATPIQTTAGPGLAVVTGAHQTLGRAVALALGVNGHRLLLQDDGNPENRAAMTAILNRRGCPSPTFVAAELGTPSGRRLLAEALGEHADLESVVHATQAPMGATLEERVALHYETLADLLPGLLPTMLARQKGRVLLLGNLPGETDIPAAERAAQAMARVPLADLEARYANYGVRGLQLLASALDKDGGLLAEEVAATVVELLANPRETVTLQEVGRLSSGNLTFVAQCAPAPGAPRGDTEQVPATPEHEPASTDIARIVCQVLRLPANTELQGGGLGLTPGWDSLRQIEIVLALEAALGIRFTSADLVSLSRFDSLQTACQNRIARHA